MPVSQECLETRTKESTRLEPTAIGGELWIACEGTPPVFFCSADQGSPTRVQAFVRVPGNEHGGQPTVILKVSAL